MAYFDSLFCLSCTVALQNCQEINGRVVVTPSEFGLHSAWMQSLKTDIVIMKSDAEEFLLLVQKSDIDPVKLLASARFNNLAIPCPEGLDIDQCRRLLSKRVTDLIVRLHMLWTSHSEQEYACMKPVNSLTALLDPRELVLDPALGRNFDFMISMADKLVNVRVRPDQDKGIKNFKLFMDAAISSATHMVTDNICPHTEDIRWAFQFTSILERDQAGISFKKPIEASMRMVFNPNSLVSAWVFQRQNAATHAWDHIFIDPEAKIPVAAMDVFSTALAGLEFWSASQKNFANIMLTWMVSLTKRDGLLPSRLTQMLRVLADLGSTNRIVMEVADMKNPNMVQRVEEMQEQASFVMDQLDTTLGTAPDAVLSWVNLVAPQTRLALPNTFGTAVGSMSFGFAAISTGFLLWNAIFVDETIAQRLYSTAQGGLIWADVFIQIALAMATNGISVPITATAGLYVAATELLAFLKTQEWFIEKFPAFVRKSAKELASMFNKRRVQVCFSAFYTAASVAENMVRDLWELKSHSYGQDSFVEAISFDRPSPDVLEERRSNPGKLFEDILFALMDGAPHGVYHNIQQHKSSLQADHNKKFVPLHICGETIKDGLHLPTRLYINQRNARWDIYLPNVDIREYNLCRAGHKKNNRDTKLATRLPCSPSEMILAFYHRVRKFDTDSLLQDQLKSSTDKILRIIASPASALAAMARPAVLEMVEGARQLQTKVFLDQDLGMLTVWFTMNVFHMLTFSSTNSREVRVFDKKNRQKLLNVTSLDDDLKVCDRFDIDAAYFSADSTCGKVHRVTSDPINDQQMSSHRLTMIAREKAKQIRAAREERFMARGVGATVNAVPIRLT
eukprot:c9425_g1_i1.p1 GENE.c9425_g1_i1~~c9425_g1_i1.p1  ORF type:complete len:975 (+),score=235.11 c9425_g1_i1:383-2926(+)